MPKLARRLAVLCLLTTPLLSIPCYTPAFAQDQSSDSVSSRLDRLEQSMNELQRQVYQRNVSGGSPDASTDGTPPSGNQAFDAQVRMDQLESAIRDLTGRVEETQYGISQLKSRLDKMQNDDEQRFQALEHPGSAPAVVASGAPAGGQGPSGRSDAGSPPPPPSTMGFLTSPDDAPASPGGGPSAASVEANSGPGPDNPPPPPPPSVAPTAPPNANASPQGQYSAAFNLLRQAKYPESQAAFTAFLKKHPRDPLAGNAQYWLGESYFAQNQFPQAAAIFAQGFARYPQSPKATDNLLKLGISLSNIGKKREACVAFAKLDTYPKVLPAVKQREAQEKQKAHC